MDCPDCGEPTRVTETRPGPAHGIRRRRKCASCGNRFTTTEVIERTFLVRKRNGRTEAFDAAKLSRSISRSAHVLPISGQEINAITDRIERSLLTESFAGAVPTARLGERVLEELVSLSPAADLARIRYAMVFLGRSDRPAPLSNTRSFLDWLTDNYNVRDEDSSTSLIPALVLKRDGRRIEPFEEQKLHRSIAIALQDRARPDELERLARSIRAHVIEAFHGEHVVSSLQLGAEVLKQLRDCDGLAYLRFSATFKRLNSPELIALDARAVLAVEFGGLKHPSTG